jgi:hypothetical protein
MRCLRFLAFLLAGVLGIQAAAMAVHAHVPTPASDHRAHDHHQHAAEPDVDDTDHHSRSCMVAQSCFPVAHAAAVAGELAATVTVAPRPAAGGLLPLPRPHRLLRPPRPLV